MANRRWRRAPGHPVPVDRGHRIGSQVAAIFCTDSDKYIVQADDWKTGTTSRTAVVADDGFQIYADHDGAKTVDYVSFPSVYGLTAPFTVFCDEWLYSTPTNGAFIKIGSTTTGYGMGLGNPDFDNANLRLMGLFENVAWVDSGISLTSGRNTFAAVIEADSTHVRYYVNGLRVARVNAAGSMIAPATTTYVGGYIGSAAENRIPGHRQYGALLLYGDQPDSVIADLHKNTMWQVLRPRQRQQLIPSVAVTNVFNPMSGRGGTKAAPLVLH